MHPHANHRLEQAKALRKRERLELLAGLGLIALATAIFITPFIVAMLEGR